MLKIGDSIYRLSEDRKEITEEKIEVIGVNEDGSVFLSGDPDDTLGKESLAFLSREDAERYRQDPDSFPNDYGHMTPEDLNLPYKPGIYYYVEYDGLEHDWWDVFIEHFTYAMTDEKGIYVGNYESECTVGEDACFLTLKEAKKYIKNLGGRLGRIYDMTEI